MITGGLVQHLYKNIFRMQSEQLAGNPASAHCEEAAAATTAGVNTTDGATTGDVNLMAGVNQCTV